jgi:hypothetical protein
MAFGHQLVGIGRNDYENGSPGRSPASICQAVSRGAPPKLLVAPISQFDGIFISNSSLSIKLNREFEGSPDLLLQIQRKLAH